MVSPRLLFQCITQQFVQNPSWVYDTYPYIVMRFLPQLNQLGNSVVVVRSIRSVRFVSHSAVARLPLDIVIAIINPIVAGITVPPYP